MTASSDMITGTRLLFAASALLLGGCMSSPPQSDNDGNYNPNAGRYSIENDIPDLESIDISTIEPVVPRAEPRTRAGNKSPYTINGRTYFVRDTEVGYVANGYASWYGRKFHGHQTSNGESYDMFKLSAAHKTLPIPSYARVTNLDNGKSVVVRINDRGPFHDDRIIDLSYAAATMLDYTRQGTARVKVEAVLPNAPQPGTELVSNQTGGGPVAAAATYAPPALTSEPLPATGASTASATRASAGDYLQVGAFSSIDSASSLLARLTGMTAVPGIIHSEAQPDSGTLLHRVRLGPLDAAMDVDNLIRMIRDANLGNPFRVSQ